MCEAERRLRQVSYELDQMRGNGVIDIGKLKKLTDADCDCGKDNQ
jgi:hypothetical protein